eukprot:scaffold2022_cov261-Pinguiococcus_pyrenoidosus.AAC.27
MLQQPAKHRGSLPQLPVGAVRVASFAVVDLHLVHGCFTRRQRVLSPSFIDDARKLGKIRGADHWCLRKHSLLLPLERSFKNAPFSTLNRGCQDPLFLVLTDRGLPNPVILLGVLGIRLKACSSSLLSAIEALLRHGTPLSTRGL